MVVSRSRGFALVDASEETVRPLGDLWADEQVRMNDGGCDPDGRFYCGSVDRVAGKKRGALYRLNLDHTMDVVLTGVAASNGLAWSPDGSRAYYVDTLTQRIDVLDYEPGGDFTGRRALARIPDQVGSPDGISVDSEGYVWVALWDGGAVHRYSPSGRLDGRIEVPVKRPTACAFGGPRLDQLFITTSRLGIDATQQPLAGAVFRADVGVAGPPVTPFAA